MQATHIEIPLFFPVLFASLALVFGSFLTCCVYRIPRGESIRTKHSRCPKCGTDLKVLDLVPVFSYLLSGGKCRHCGVKIPLQYVLIELSDLALTALLWFVFGAQPIFLLAFVALQCWLFVLWVFILERQLASKVLLFSIILTGYIGFVL